MKTEHKIKVDCVERYQKQMQADHRSEMEDFLTQNNISPMSIPRSGKKTSEAGL